MIFQGLESGGDCVTYVRVVAGLFFGLPLKFALILCVGASCCLNQRPQWFGLVQQTACNKWEIEFLALHPQQQCIGDFGRFAFFLGSVEISSYRFLNF